MKKYEYYYTIYIDTILYLYGIMSIGTCSMAKHQESNFSTQQNRKRKYLYIFALALALKLDMMYFLKR